MLFNGIPLKQTMGKEKSGKWKMNKEKEKETSKERQIILK